MEMSFFFARARVGKPRMTRMARIKRMFLWVDALVSDP
jgi:hypothetical protein